MSGDNTDTDLARKQLGEKLRRAREYIGLSQDDVAKHLALPRTALSNMESGTRRVDALELQKLANLYRRSMGYFTEEPDDAASTLPDVAHLARTAATLSKQDREELGRFADYLRTRARKEPME